MIKLFEQWLSEEDSPAVKAVEPTPTAKPGSYKLKIEAEGKSFEVEGTSDKEFSSSAAVSFNVTTSNSPAVKSGAVIMISPKADKDGDFDIVILNDQSKPEAALVYSGKVTKESLAN